MKAIKLLIVILIAMMCIPTAHAIDMDNSAVADDIKLYLFDYGNLINTTSGAVLNFFASVDNQLDTAEVGGGGRVTMAPALVNGYPYVNSMTAMPGRSGSLKYLFDTERVNDFVGGGTITNYLTQLYNSNGSDYTSMRFEVNGVINSNGDTGTGLFKKDSKGYYYYSSSKNSAYFNKSTGIFELYDYHELPSFMEITKHCNNLKFNADTIAKHGINYTNMMNYFKGVSSDYKTTADGIQQMWYKGYAENFLPFELGHSVGTTITSADNTHTSTIYKHAGSGRSTTTNLWFGMYMEFEFYMPKDGKINGEDVIFEFFGDDDVLVYVDDVLVLDMGGDHYSAYGAVNFATGDIIHPSPDRNSSHSESPNDYGLYNLYDRFVEAKNFDSSIQTTSFDSSNTTFEDYTRHTLKFYYLERGGMYSYCDIKFNLPILPKHSLNVEKTISGDESPQLGNPDFRFQVLNEDGQTKLENTKYTVYDILTNTEVSSGLTDENGCFTIKSGQRATFEGLEANSGKYVIQELLEEDLFKQYCEVNVDGVVYTTDLIQSDILIGTQIFKGFMSPAKNISDGILLYVFDNNIDVTEYGSIIITKSILGEESMSNVGFNPIYKVHVNLDDLPIPVGTLYTVNGENKYVETEGIVEIGLEYPVIIPDIISGTHYEVWEDLSSTDGYTGITYENENGTIELSEEVNIKITNIPGVLLPNTYSTGYTFIYVLACIMICIVIPIKRYKSCS